MYRSIINGQSSELHLARLLAERGPLQDPLPADPVTLAAYEGRLPDILLDFWENHGFGALAGGLIRIIHPQQYAAAVAKLFEGDPDFAGDCHAIALGPFGDMMLWSARHQLVFVSLPLSMVDAPLRFRPAPRDQDDLIVLTHVLNAAPAVFDTADDAGAPMFARAREALGPLGPDEVYGTVPAVTYGEALAVEALQRVEAGEWLVERFSGYVYSLNDLQAGQFNLRDIGPQPAGMVQP